MKQYYTDDSGHVSSFEDDRENYHSQKAKPENIKVIKGDATPEEIADDINYNKAKANGQAVGWRR